MILLILIPVALMNSIASLDTEKDTVLHPIPGTPPDLFAPPKGCPFAARCDYAMKVCQEYPPDYTQLSDEHRTACWLQHEFAPDVDLRKSRKETV